MTGDVGITSALAEIARRRVVVMATTHADGRPHLSLVRPWVHDDGRIDLTLTDRRVKTRNLRADPRLALLAASADDGRFVVVEGTAELSPISVVPGDAVGRTLVDMYRALAGEHPDWDAFQEAMVQDRRLVARVAATRAYQGGTHE